MGFMLVEALQQHLEITPRELPLERFGNCLIMFLEAKEALFYFFEGTEVIWRESFALDDREVDLNLVQPTGMNGCVDRDDGRPLFLKAPDARLASVGRAVVHDPKHPGRRAVWLLAHDLLDQAIERSDSGFLLATTIDLDVGRIKPLFEVDSN